MKKLIALGLIAAGMISSAPSFAHGAKPKHGGTVQSAADLSFELVAKDGKAVIYIDDHNVARSTTGATGTLTVLSGGKKSEAALEPAGDNALASKTAVHIGRGTKAVASITLQGKDPISVRFSKK